MGGPWMAVIAGANVLYREWLKTGERMLAMTASSSGWHRYCCLVATGGGGGVGWKHTHTHTHARTHTHTHHDAILFTNWQWLKWNIWSVISRCFRVIIFRISQGFLRPRPEPNQDYSTLWGVLYYWFRHFNDSFVEFADVCFIWLIWSWIFRSYLL